MNWTEGRIKGFIVSVLRAGARRWPAKYEVLDEACVGKKINEKTGRMAKHYVCADCGKEFTSKDVEVDHILPVVDPTDGFIDWNTFISRLYCTKDNLQVLCTTCHKRKTKLERSKSTKRKTKKTSS